MVGRLVVTVATDAPVDVARSARRAAAPFTCAIVVRSAPMSS
jgi:hypothetical protein